MTQEEILQYNKRCAEFLGAEIQDVLERIYIDKMKDDELLFHDISVTLQTYEWNGTTNIHYIPFDMLSFHSDWNCIMAVVEAIEKLGETSTMYGTLVDITTTYIAIGEIAIDLKLVPMTKKEAVVEAINQFLIYYNNE